eukprot:CAMPEP_0197633760 /NCGR_PEP_ID=MMETSP1338-20131121/10050_1 /TAXON_ID=43686 ORGANISM="Pelagodinium beii, Strain RCC1491" /NCGR_SAMPLE_ID=MMETSP1338 /ASSEMBLY_ACC=CAM_ASM_000754 /LENGTH=269 /DNA_ID=CAMNT_0043205493 /DNA_START=195 /DNA_END=1004 /DNA_ORIENTATION=-
MPGMPAGMPNGMNMQALEELMKDPEKMKELQSEVDKMMQDPEKKKQMEAYQARTQAAVAKLQDDPELKDFFDDVKKNGLEAMKKYENDERILEKFSSATGGPQSMPGMDALMGGAGGMGAAPPAAPALKPGDEVIINGLSKAPELNGKKAMVVPPTAEEKQTLEGTDRLIVRLLDSGEQFAVRPSNLRTTAQEADALMSSSLEDVSLYNPALQSEAAKLRASGKLDDLQNDPELQPVFEDIKKNGMSALEKYWDDEKLMAKITKAMGTR